MTVVYQTTDVNSPIPIFNHRHFERGHRCSSMKSPAVTRTHDRKSRNSALPADFTHREARSLGFVVRAFRSYHRHRRVIPTKYQISSMKTLFYGPIIILERYVPLLCTRVNTSRWPTGNNCRSRKMWKQFSSILGTNFCFSETQGPIFWIFATGDVCLSVRGCLTFVSFVRCFLMTRNREGIFILEYF